MNKAIIIGAVLCLTGCATADLPDGFIYETSLRGQQDWYGASGRNAAAAELLSRGVVTSPQAAFETVLPNAEINLRQWGVSYFNKDWTRYRVLVEADIRQNEETVKCRLSEPENIEDAPLLRELEADGGELFQKSLNILVAACVNTVLNPASP